jgi:hypothetical protein
MISLSPIQANDAISKKVKNIFKNEQLFTDTNLQGVSAYGYTTNTTFEEALKKLKTSLGTEWKEDQTGKEQAKEILKKSGQELNGMVMFTNKTHMISITHMNLKLEGNKYLLQITINSLKK